MNRSLHDPKNKTQTMFKGWDFTEITEWLDVNDNHTTYSRIYFRIKVFFNTVNKAVKELFASFGYDSEILSNYKTKKAINFLIIKYNESIENGTQLDPKILKKIDGLRTYMEKLVEQDNTEITSVWKALIEIEDDEIFLHYIKYFLESLWD